MDKGLRHLPRYFYRRLPNSFYLPDPFAAVGVGASVILEAAQSKNPTLVADAELETGGKAKLLYGDEAGIEDGKKAHDEEEEAPWCR